ncbi:MAG: cold-shock protein [Ponticaulis sp.]|nr:cold-shock protein [Ponticaulis sp.]
MPIGTVKTFNAEDGFGIITPDDGSPDVRVDLGIIEKAGLFVLLVGEQIFFDIQTDPELTISNLRQVSS